MFHMHRLELTVGSIIEIVLKLQSAVYDSVKLHYVSITL